MDAKIVNATDIERTVRSMEASLNAWKIETVLLDL
jgi:hypothetical protein